MSKDPLPKSEIMIDAVEQFRSLDTSGFPDFHLYRSTLERGLWVLWVSKEKLGTRRLKAEEIASVIVEVEETSISAQSIIKAFNRGGDKIHAHREGESTSFELMKSGKDFLLSKIREGSVQLFYFEPDRRYSSKRVMASNILGTLGGDLKIVDPYCNERTLDVLKEIKGRRAKVLTRLENIREKDRDRFLREIVDFKSENENIEFRSYPHTDIHDRYVMSSEYLVILGHSIKDLGSKESFAILLDKNASRNIVEALDENFDRRWKQSETF